MEAWCNVEDAIVKVKMASYNIFSLILNSSSTISMRKTLAPQNPIYAHNKTIAKPRPITTGIWMTFFVTIWLVPVKAEVAKDELPVDGNIDNGPLL
jgi:hypothetical protein